MQQVAGVHKAINAVQAALAKEGIGKDRKNDQQGYKFRGIDDMYNVMAPHLSANGLVVLPRYSERQVVERTTKHGTALFYVTIKGDFTFLASDGSRVDVTTYGEAMDSGDKATNKAMSAALKYAFMQTFTIPTEGDNDTENQTHEVKGVPITPTGGVWESLDVETQNWLMERAGNVRALLKKNDDAGAWDELIDREHEMDEHQRVGLWSRFDSKERARLKKAGDAKKQPQQGAH